MTAVYYRRGGDTSGSAANGHPEPRNWAIRVSIGRKSVVTTFKPRGATVAVVMRGTAATEAVGPERRDPVHLALNLPESVSKAVRPPGLAAVQSARAASTAVKIKFCLFSDSF